MFKPRRRFLLFSSIDTDRQAYRQWLDGTYRNFDVVLYTYRGEPTDTGADYCVSQKGFKFQNFYHFSKICNIFHYDAIWIPDDDIQVSTKDINTLFEIFHNNQLSLAQPSYDEDSSSSWKLAFEDADYKLRYTNFVENGVVLMSRKALNICLPSFRKIRSGWGADFLWPFQLGFPERGIAIIDAVQCHHPKSQSTLDESMPRLLHRWDGEQMMAHFNAWYYTPCVCENGEIIRPITPVNLLAGIRKYRQNILELYRDGTRCVQDLNKELNSHLDKAWNHYHLGALDVADKLFIDAQRLWPNDPLPYIAHAQEAVACKDYRQALKRWLVVKENFPEYVGADTAIGICYIELGELDKATPILADMRKRLNSCLGEYFSSLKQGKELMHAGQYREAEAIFLEIQSLWPDQPGGYNAYHILLEKMRREFDNISLTFGNHA